MSRCSQCGGEGNCCNHQWPDAVLIQESREGRPGGLSRRRTPRRLKPVAKKRQRWLRRTNCVSPGELRFGSDNASREVQANFGRRVEEVVQAHLRVNAAHSCGATHLFFDTSSGVADFHAFLRTSGVSAAAVSRFIAQQRLTSGGAQFVPDIGLRRGDGTIEIYEIKPWSISGTHAVARKLGTLLAAARATPLPLVAGSCFSATLARTMAVCRYRGQSFSLNLAVFSAGLGAVVYTVCAPQVPAGISTLAWGRIVKTAIFKASRTPLSQWPVEA